MDNTQSKARRKPACAREDRINRGDPTNFSTAISQPQCGYSRDQRAKRVASNAKRPLWRRFGYTLRYLRKDRLKIWMFELPRPIGIVNQDKWQLSFAALDEASHVRINASGARKKNKRG